MSASEDPLVCYTDAGIHRGKRRMFHREHPLIPSPFMLNSFE
jgi:hypothetical protein